MRKRPKGSAILWAVCTLMIVVILMTGLLAVNSSYAETEINNIATRRAEYLARSGIEVTLESINNKSLSDNILNEVTSTSEMVVTYRWENNDDDVSEVTIGRRSGNEIRITSKGFAGGMDKTVIAIAEKTGTNSWEIKGYATT